MDRTIRSRWTSGSFIIFVIQMLTGLEDSDNAASYGLKVQRAKGAAGRSEVYQAMSQQSNDS